MSQARRVGKNVLLTLVTQLVSWGLTFAVTLFLPRYLNDTGLGTFTLVGSIMSILSVLVGLGTSTVLIKEIARDPSRLGSLVLGAICLRLPLGLVSIGAGWCIVKALGYTEELQQLVLLGTLGMIVMQICDVLTSALRGLEDFPRQNAIALAERFISSAAYIALVFLRAPLWAFVAVIMAASSVSLLLSFFALRTHLRTAKQVWNLRIEADTMRALFKAGLPFLTGAVFVAIYGQSDALLLSKLSTVAAIGWYGLAKRLGGSTMVIPTTVCSTMLPLLARVYHEDTERFSTIAQRMFNLMIVSVIPFAILLMLAPGQLLSLLHYPPSFKNSIPVLVILGAGVVLWFLSQAAGTALIASDRQVVFAKVTGIAALISVPLCAACIYLAEKYLHNGAIGAILSDVLLEVYMLIAYLRALPKGVITQQSGGMLLRAAAAALPLVCLFQFVQGREALYLPAIGFLLYLPLCKVLGCLSDNDLQLFRGMFKKNAVA